MGEERGREEGQWDGEKTERVHEGLGRLNLGNDREREQGKRYLDKGSHYGVSEKPGTREIPRNPQR